MREFMAEKFGISDGVLLDVLAEHGKVEHVKRGQVLISSGEEQVNLPVLLSGIYRGFVLDEEGREVTDCFACTPGDVIVGCGSLDAPSRISVEAMTDGDILYLPVESVLKGLMRSREMMVVYNNTLLEALSRHWELKILLLRCSSMERYQWFLRKYPGLIDQVSNKHIASFLGMTPVTLSRLRQRCKEVTGSTCGIIE